MKKQATVVFLVAIAFVAMAQYSIDWSTIDGGSGTMAGGAYTIRGTIGQHDADGMSGGGFDISGGFWVPQAVQAEGAPHLAIAVTGIAEITILWVPDDPGWFLQAKTSLTTIWVDSASGTNNPVVIPATEAAMFYRLHK